jgi:hypothetical protein
MVVLAAAMLVLLGIARDERRMLQARDKARNVRADARPRRTGRRTVAGGVVLICSELSGQRELTQNPLSGKLGADQSVSPYGRCRRSTVRLSLPACGGSGSVPSPVPLTSPPPRGAEVRNTSNSTPPPKTKPKKTKEKPQAQPEGPTGKTGNSGSAWAAKER